MMLGIMQIGVVVPDRICLCVESERPTRHWIDRDCGFKSFDFSETVPKAFTTEIQTNKFYSGLTHSHCSCRIILTTAIAELPYIERVINSSNDLLVMSILGLSLLQTHSSWVQDGTGKIGESKVVPMAAALPITSNNHLFCHQLVIEFTKMVCSSCQFWDYPYRG